jgi:hypothetical protein
VHAKHYAEFVAFPTVINEAMSRGSKADVIVIAAATINAVLFGRRSGVTSCVIDGTIVADWRSTWFETHLNRLARG